VGQVVEIGASQPDAEHRRIDRVEGTGVTRTITLDAGLTLGYAAGAPVTPLTQAGGTAAHLQTAATAGDCVIFADGLAGAFTNPVHLVVIDPGSPNVEVRRVAALNELALVRAAYADYPRGSRVLHIQANADQRTLAQPSNIGDDTVTLNDVSGLEAGQQ